jgi:hypothetical protein
LRRFVVTRAQGGFGRVGRYSSIGETGVVTAKGIELSIRPDDVGATAVDPVFVPRPRVHEGLDEKTKRIGFVQLEFAEQFAERLGIAAALHEVFEFVADLVAEESLHLREVDEVADGISAAIRLEQVTDRGAIRIAAGQRGEIFETQSIAGLRDGGENDVGGIQSRAGIQRNAAAAEHRLKRDAADVRIVQTELDRFPEMREILGRHRHREGDGKIHFRAALDGAPAGVAQIGAAEEVLAVELHAIELQIKLETAVIEAAAELVLECPIVRDPDAGNRFPDLRGPRRAARRIADARSARRRKAGESRCCLCDR